MSKKIIFIKLTLFFLLIFFSNNLFAKIPVGKAAIIIDFDTQETIFEVNANTLNFPASLTKMMTLYIVFDYQCSFHPLDYQILNHNLVL